MTPTFLPSFWAVGALRRDQQELFAEQASPLGMAEFTQILASRRVMASSLQTSIDQGRSGSPADGAVEFAALALFQGGVAVERQAISHIPDRASVPLEVILPEVGAKNSPMTEIMEPDSCLGDPAENNKAAAIRHFAEMPTASNQTTADFTVVESRQSDTLPNRVSVGFGSRPTPSVDTNETRNTRTHEGSRQRLNPKSDSLSPVAVGLYEVDGQVAVYARLTAMTAEEETEFELRVRDELAASLRGLNQLKINGRQKPRVGGR